MAVALMKRFPECRTGALAVRYTKRVHARAEVLVRRHWSEICEVAEMLLEEKTVSEGAVLSVLREEADCCLAISLIERTIDGLRDVLLAPHVGVVAGEAR